MTDEADVDPGAPVGRSGLKTALLWVATILVVIGLAFSAWWRISGGKWERVETPSMGTIAPVGSLLWVKPVPFDSLKVGDFITFHPPGESQVYSHLIKGINKDGTLATGGQISGSDPWAISESEVVGKVHYNWFGVGWIIKAMPVLLVGGALLWTALTFARRDWRLPLGILIVYGTLTAALVIYQPLTQAQQLAFSGDNGVVKASYVNTGLLPLEVSAIMEEDSKVITPGEVGEIVSSVPDKKGEFGVKVVPAIPLWFWILLLGSCFLPAVWTLLVGVEVEVEPEPADEEVAVPA